MTRQPQAMPLAFQASQNLNLPVRQNAERLPAYLLEQDRVLAALLEWEKLTPLGEGRFSYAVTSLNVFQLQINPVVSLKVDNCDGKLSIRATDSELKGLDLVDDFDLGLEAIMEATPKGLEGEALLSVSVTPPALLKLIPKGVLKSTGQSILSGILLGIKTRVGQQLVKDFSQWCQETPIRSSETAINSKQLGEE
ncbi:MAG: DUF1997 domain-containing protein [Cyanobacteriota bacterium]|nr:DUF1997 domain-containing protein [Cyanobacteriota bacterium]